MIVQVPIDATVVLETMNPNELMSFVASKGLINEDMIVDLIDSGNLNLTNILGKVALKRFETTIDNAVDNIASQTEKE